MQRVYLDHQSGSLPYPEVVEAMCPWIEQEPGAPTSRHQEGLLAKDAVGAARQSFAGFLNAAEAEEILFTSGGTESLNLAVKGLAWAREKWGRHLVCSAIEHPAILNAMGWLEKRGWTVTRLPVDGEGRLDPESVRSALTGETVLVALHAGNHDLGTVQPLAAVGSLCREHGAALLVDATTAAGWMPLDVRGVGASLVALSPHRFGGPKGVGVLYRRGRMALEPLLHGGNQEQGLRAGTEPVAGIVGAGRAADLATGDFQERTAGLQGVQKVFWEGLQRAIAGVHLHGPEPGPDRLPTVLNVSFDGLEGEGVMLRADLKGLAFASGTACASKVLGVSHVLQAIGVPRERAQGNVLFSLGRTTTEADVRTALEWLPDIVRRLREMSPGE